ncbi:hypothetical protein [Microbacterium sp.]|uniref:hypothetical protein n=1 Tax=Microbacterium sp. TaxID=51671 RepID=UPI003A83956A
MVSSSTVLRRIAFDIAGRRHDVVVPTGDRLGSALSATGVRLTAADRVLTPDGQVVSPQTPAADLREGGLYVIARDGDRRAMRRAATGPRAAARSLHWALGAFGLAAAMVAVAQVASQAPTLAVAAAAIAVTLGGAILGVAARTPATRAVALPVQVIAGGVALLALLAAPLQWQVGELVVVVGAIAVVGLRAAPSMIVAVDPGYYIDYARFIDLRWTVRGRVPEAIVDVDNTRVARRMSAAATTLTTSVVLLSLLAAAGIAAAAQPLATGTVVERVCAGATVVFGVLGLVLTSRRTVAPVLRHPPRIAAAVGLVLLAALVGPVAPGVLVSVTASVLLIVALIVAIALPAISRGERSLGWSRAADIVDSLAIALVLPAGLIAAGTWDLLRGVWAG